MKCLFKKDIYSLVKMIGFHLLSKSSILGSLSYLRCWDISREGFMGSNRIPSKVPNWTIFFSPSAPASVIFLTKLYNLKYTDLSISKSPSKKGEIQSTLKLWQMNQQWLIKEFPSRESKHSFIKGILRKYFYITECCFTSSTSPSKQS